MMSNDVAAAEATDLFMTMKAFETSLQSVKRSMRNKFDEDYHLRKLEDDTGDADSGDLYWRVKATLENISDRLQKQAKVAYVIMLASGHTLIPFFGWKKIHRLLSCTRYNFKARFTKCLDILDDCNPRTVENMRNPELTKLLLAEMGQEMESFWSYSDYLRTLPNRTLFTKSQKNDYLMSWLFATFSVNRSWPATRSAFNERYAALIGQQPYLTLGRYRNRHRLGISVHMRDNVIGIYLIKNIPRPHKGKDEKTTTLLLEFFLWYVRRQILEGEEVSELENPFEELANVSPDFIRDVNRSLLGRAV